MQLSPHCGSRWLITALILWAGQVVAQPPEHRWTLEQPQAIEGQPPEHQRVPEPTPAVEGQAQKKARSDYRPAQPPPAMVRIIESPEESEAAAEREAKSDEHDAEDLAAQQKAADAAQIAAAAAKRQVEAAYVGIVLSGLGTGLLVWTLYLTREANSISRDVYFADQRPWVAVDINVSGPIRIDRNGLSIRLDIELRNTGRTPALTTYVFLQVLAHACGRNVQVAQADIERLAMNSIDGKMGINLFPGQMRVWQKHTFTVDTLELTAIDRWHQQISSQANYELLPLVLGCVWYFSSGRKAPHRTPIICHISRKPDGGRYRVISRVDEQIPADELELRWSSIRMLAD